MKLRLLVLFIAASQLLHAQTISTSSTDASATTPKLLDYSYPGLKKIGNNYFAFEYDIFKKHMIVRLKKLDANFNVIKESDPLNAEMIYDLFGAQFQVSGNKLFLFYLQGNKKAHIMKTFVSMIDISTMTFGIPTELMTTEWMDVLPLHNDDDKIKLADLLTISQSSDSSKNIILWQSYDRKLFFYSVTNSDFKPIRSGKGEITDGKEVQPITNIAVTNSGIVYVSYTYVKKSYYSSFIYINSSDDVTNLIEIKDPGIQVATAFLAPISDNKVAITGTYLSDSHNDNLSGVFYQTLEVTSNKLDAMNKTIFPDSLITELENLKWANSQKNKFGITPIDLKMHLFNDGTISLFGQFNETLYSTRSGEAPTSPSDIEHTRYGNIFNVYLKNEKAVFSSIPKNVPLTVWKEASFYPVFYKNKLLVFYNDNPLNVAKSLSEKPINLDFPNNSNIVVVSASFERDGTIKRSILIEPEEKYTLAMFDGAKNTADNEFVLPRGKISLAGWNKIAYWTTIKIK